MELTFDIYKENQLMITGTDYETLDPVRRQFEKYGATWLGPYFLGGFNEKNYIAYIFFKGEADLQALREMYPIPAAITLCDRPQDR